MIITLLLLINTVFNINFQLKKKNIIIPDNSQYIATVDIQRENAQLIPVNISLLTTITNALPSYHSYFDYFYCLTPHDLSCYHSSVRNQSYLYPCSFIQNKYSQLRTTQVKGHRINQDIDDLKNMKFSFIIDNTPYPYPSGAYSYSPVTIDVNLQVSITISSNYEVLGQRLIWINVTVCLIFLLIITILVCKTKRLAKRMDTSKMSEARRSQIEQAMSRRFDSSDSDNSSNRQSASDLKEKLILEESSQMEEDRSQEHEYTRSRKKSVQSRFPLGSIKSSMIQ